MEPQMVSKLGRTLLNEHKLHHWLFLLDRSKVRFGVCKHEEKIISVSEPLCRMNNGEEIRNTILHEIAHAIAGHSAGHGQCWKLIALSIGCNGKRCYSRSEVNTPDPKITLECTVCNKRWKRHRRLRKKNRYCVGCYREYGDRIPVISYATQDERQEQYDKLKVGV